MLTEVIQKGPYRILKLADNPDSEAKLAALRSEFEKQIRQGESHLVVDFSSLPSVDIRVLPLIREIHEKIHASGGRVGLVTGSHDFSEILRLSGIDDFAKVFIAPEDLEFPADTPPVSTASPHRNIRIQSRGDYKVVIVDSKLDDDGIEKLRAVVEKLMRRQEKKMVFDLHGLSSISSSLLGIIVMAYNAFRLKGEIHVLTHSKTIKDTVCDLNLGKLLTLFDSDTDFYDAVSNQGENLDPTTILIVDDSQSMRDLLKKYIGSMGYEFLEAKTGKEAVQVAVDREPDLILMDIDMPEMDGFEACQRIKEAMPGRHVPIIFITCLEEEEQRFKALECGGDDFLLKGFTEADLIFRIKNHIRLKRMIQRPEAL